MPRDAVSRTANVGTLGMNGLTSKGPDLNLLTMISKNEIRKFKFWSDSNRLTVNVEKKQLSTCK